MRKHNLTLIGLLVSLISLPSAAVPHQGTVAAVIRSADQPCARVIELEQVEVKKDGTTVLKVQCNSGYYKVTYKGDKLIDVTPQK